ncbi:MAG: armadillo-type fold-containing protein [Goleter apudmare HA4340-LM2]|nr:armadillo-type fold-containing protein [Goleter apudmare HA4340-LM2]
MAQASSSWQQLISQIPNWSLPGFKTGSPKQRNFKGFSGLGNILWFLTIVVAMLFWNWKLLLALVVGVGVMLVVYAMQAWDWRLRWLEIRKFLNNPNRRLVLAVGSGGIATASTYTAAAIWVDASSPWMATGAIAQGLVTLLTLILLVWQIVNLHTSQEQGQLDQLMVNLTETDPLKRLIAVQRLTKLITRQRVDAAVQQNFSACLRLLLSREEEVVIREAAFESLQVLDRLQVLPSSTAVPLHYPQLKVQSQKSQIRH